MFKDTLENEFVKAQKNASERERMLLFFPTCSFLGAGQFCVASRISGYSSIYTQCLFQLVGGLHLGMNWKLDAEWSLRDLNPTGAPGFYPSLELQKEALRSMKTSLKYSMSDLEMYQFSSIGILPSLVNRLKRTWENEDNMDFIVAVWVVECVDIVFVCIFYITYVRSVLDI